MTGILPNFHRLYVSGPDDKRLARVDLHAHGVVEITNLVQGAKLVCNSLCDWIGLSTSLNKYDRKFLPLEASWRVMLADVQSISCQKGLLTINGETKIDARSTIDELKLLGIKFGLSKQAKSLAMSVNSDGVNIRDLKTEQKLFSLVYDDGGFLQVKGHPAIQSEIEMLTMHEESTAREILGGAFKTSRLHELEPKPGASYSLSINTAEDCLFRFRGSVFYYDHRSQKLIMQNGLRQKTVQLKIPERQALLDRETRVLGNTPQYHEVQESAPASDMDNQITRDLSVRAA